jgi:hypothetical protein
MRTLLVSQLLRPAHTRGLVASLALAAGLAGITRTFELRYSPDRPNAYFDKAPESAAADYLGRAFNVYHIHNVRLSSNQGLLQQLFSRNAGVRAEIDVEIANQRGQTKRACLVARAKGWLLPGPRLIRTGEWQITPTLGGPCR